MDTFTTIDLSPLTPRQRDVIEMRYANGLSFGAIAAVLGLSKSSIQVHHDRALSKLRNTMEEEA